MTDDRVDDAGTDGISRRTVIRLLVGLGIGVPILVELATFLGLLGHRLGGGDGGDGGEQPGTAAQGEGVGPGDELLPETPPTDTLRIAQLRADADAWVLTLGVDVTNDTGDEYVLRLGAVTTSNGKTVDGDGPQTRVAPGESGAVLGTWDLPPGSTPAELAVRTTLGGESADHRVRLGKLPVRGR